MDVEGIRKRREHIYLFPNKGEVPSTFNCTYVQKIEEAIKDVDFLLSEIAHLETENKRLRDENITWKNKAWELSSQLVALKDRVEDAVTSIRGARHLIPGFWGGEIQVMIDSMEDV